MKILPLLALLSLNFGIAACSTMKPKQTDCWNESSAQDLLEKLSRVTQTMRESHSHSNILKPTLIEASCAKRKYRLGDDFLILVNHPDQTITGRTWYASSDPIECMRRARADIDSFDSAYYRGILKHHQEVHPEQWSDPDLSPVGWLRCDQGAVAYRDSVVEFLHELTHDLRDDTQGCLHLAMKDETVCFHLPKSLPLRSYGKLDSFPTKNAAALRGLQTIQKIYLTDIDMPFLLLADELNAYQVTAQAYRSFLERDGTKAFYDSDGKRPGIFLPLFYNITMRYLERLKREHPDTFATVFLNDRGNRAALKSLLSSSRKVYSTWKASLKAHGKPEKEWEKALYSDALRLESKLSF